MKLPKPVKTYFNADRGQSAEPPVDAFAPHAVVKDEGKTHTGREAIGAWWSAAKAEYQATSEPRELTQENGVTTVRAMVTGDFPVSPAMLKFAFTLEDDQIAALEIGS